MPTSEWLVIALMKTAIALSNLSYKVAVSTRSGTQPVQTHFMSEGYTIMFQYRGSFVLSLAKAEHINSRCENYKDSRSGPWLVHLLNEPNGNLAVWCYIIVKI